MYLFIKLVYILTNILAGKFSLLNNSSKPILFEAVPVKKKEFVPINKWLGSATVLIIIVKMIIWIIYL